MRLVSSRMSQARALAGSAILLAVLVAPNALFAQEPAASPNPDLAAQIAALLGGPQAAATNPAQPWPYVIRPGTLTAFELDELIDPDPTHGNARGRNQPVTVTLVST